MTQQPVKTGWTLTIFLFKSVLLQKRPNSMLAASTAGLKIIRSSKNSVAILHQAAPRRIPWDIKYKQPITIRHHWIIRREELEMCAYKKCNAQHYQALPLPPIHVIQALILKTKHELPGSIWKRRAEWDTSSSHIPNTFKQQCLFWRRELSPFLISACVGMRSFICFVTSACRSKGNALSDITEHSNQTPPQGKDSLQKATHKAMDGHWNSGSLLLERTQMCEDEGVLWRPNQRSERWVKQKSQEQKEENAVDAVKLRKHCSPCRQNRNSHWG